MENSSFIYLRGLRHVEHTVFNVENGQKFYREPQFGRSMAYSSGQQVKRSILEALELQTAAITFNWEIKGGKNGKAGMKEPHSPCDPTFVDQLIGGFMKAQSDSYTVKRRSPLSISAMRPLHPLLGGIENETEAVCFDRADKPNNHKVVVSITNSDGKREVISDEALNDWLTKNNRNLPPKYYNPSGQTRATGLFVYDLAIDLRTLFCVSTNRLQPELFPEMEERLREEGWVEGENIFGKCLICPKEKRDIIIPRLAKAIINWRITSNQARTFSLMETVAVAISDNVNQIAYAIRAELLDNVEYQKATPRIDETAKADLFISPIASGVIPGIIGDVNALDAAEQRLIDIMNGFDYENQL